MPTTHQNNTQTPKDKDRALPRRRISPAIRQAVRLIVRNAHTQREAAKIVGMNETSLGRALKKEHVQALMEKEKTALLADGASIRNIAIASAYVVGMELMHKASSEAVRARMVELFTRQGAEQGPTVVVNQVNSGGYGYSAPPQRRQPEPIDVTPDYDA